MTYTVVLMREEDGRYSVSVPALPGCLTWGRDIAHALQMVEDAIRGYVAALRQDGQEAPADKPRVHLNMVRSTEALVYRLSIEERSAVA
jgi:antitoxin HicB